MFPLDMPWAGDWYLWCAYALHYDVAYFAEPMVCYREHELSMTTKLTGSKLDACAEEEIAIPWLIRTKALESGYSEVAKDCLSAVVDTYVRLTSSELYRRSSWFMNLDRLEDSLAKTATTEIERDWIRGRVYAGIGNQCYWRNEPVLAKRFYGIALEKAPAMVSVQVKRALLALGKPGDLIRRSFRAPIPK
jgi:hypothetical protein